MAVLLIPAGIDDDVNIFVQPNCVTAAAINQMQMQQFECR